MKKRRETSKVLLWTIISLSAFFCLLSLTLCAIFAPDQLGTAAMTVGGLWGASVPVAVGFYSDKAKAENEIKLAQNAELEVLRVEMSSQQEQIEALLEAAQAPAPKKRTTAAKTPKPFDAAAFGGAVAALLEQALAGDDGQQRLDL